MESYFISVLLLWGDAYALYVDDLRRRMILQAIRPAAIPITATPPTTPPTIAPILTFFGLGVVVEVEVAEVLVG